MSLLDVSAAKAKERAARFAASFDPGPPGPAGVLGMQRDRPVRIAERLPVDRRSAFWGTVTGRLTGTPSDASVERVAMLVAGEIQRGELLARRA